MLAPFHEFTSRVEELKNYLSFLDSAEGSIRPPLPQSTLRTFRYATGIVSLFGHLEQFIEGLMQTYLRQMTTNAAKYSELDERIKNSHLRLSIDLLAKIEQTRFRDTLPIAEIVKILNGAFTDQIPCSLNEASFIHHTANFRWTVIGDYFSRVTDVKLLEHVLRYRLLQNWLSEKAYDYEPAFILDDLCDRRNELAHGSSSQILSVEMMRDYIAYIELFCRLLHDALYATLFERCFLQQADALGTPLRVIDHRIICFTNKEVALSVEDTIVQLRGGIYRPARILQMQVNRAAVQQIPAVDAAGVALEVDIRVSEEDEFFVFQAPRIQRQAYSGEDEEIEGPLVATGDEEEIGEEEEAEEERDSWEEAVQDVERWGQKEKTPMRLNQPSTPSKLKRFKVHSSKSSSFSLTRVK